MVAGRQYEATMATALPLTAPLTRLSDRADELTVRVQCQSPKGVVVLEGAALTPLD
jgi:hypothetical protein